MSCDVANFGCSRLTIVGRNKRLAKRALYYNINLFVNVNNTQTCKNLGYRGRYCVRFNALACFHKTRDGYDFLWFTLNCFAQVCIKCLDVIIDQKILII